MRCIVVNMHARLYTVEMLPAKLFSASNTDEMHDGLLDDDG